MDGETEVESLTYGGRAEETEDLRPVIWHTPSPGPQPSSRSRSSGLTQLSAAVELRSCSSSSSSRPRQSPDQEAEGLKGDLVAGCDSRVSRVKQGAGGCKGGGLESSFPFFLWD